MKIYILAKRVSILCAASVCLSASANDGMRTFEYGGRTYTYLQAVTMKEPPPGYKKVTDDRECKKNLEGIAGISQRTIDLIHLSENGTNGMAQKWPTDTPNGFNWDIGKYSINSVNWPSFDGQLTPFDLRWNDCASLVAAAYVLDEFYIAAKKQFRKDVIDEKEPVDALVKLLYNFAGYNSKTPSVRRTYTKRLVLMTGRFFFEGEDTSLWED